MTIRKDNRSTPGAATGAGRARRGVLLPLVVLLAAACADGPTRPPAGTAATVEAISARNFIGGSGQALVDSVVVRVLDRDDAPLEGASVTFTVVDGGGTTSSASVATDVSGVAATEWRLGSAGPQSLRAAVKGSGVPAILFQAVAEDTRGQARVDSNGGEVTTESGVRLVVPAGALSGTESIVIEPAEGIGEQSGLVAGAAYEFGPDGLAFAEPVTIEIPYDQSNVEAPVEELRVFRLETDGSWTQLPGIVDEDAQVVTAQTEHFSTYALRSRPFATVEAATDTISSRLGRSYGARYDVVAKHTSPIETVRYRVNDDAMNELSFAVSDSIDFTVKVSTSKLRSGRNRIDFELVGTDGFLWRFTRNLWLIGPEGSSSMLFTAPGANAIITAYPFEATVRVSDPRGIVGVSLYRGSELLGLNTFKDTPNEVTTTFKLGAMGNGNVTLRAEAHSLNNIYRASGSATVSFTTREPTMAEAPQATVVAVPDGVRLLRK
jgi:hypothetical protein